jgi:endonuclease/exonuclease/phosphatase family metal-dependent hydrolase
MKIVSWNILANEFIRKRYYPMLPSDILFKRSVRLNQIMSVLTAEDVDVILLQEVMLSEYNALERQFAKTHYLIKSKNIIWQGVRSHSMNVTLIRKTMFSVKGAMVQFYEFGLAVNCFIKDDKNRLYAITIINVHLDDLSKAKRLQQLKEINLEEKEKINVILGGDFNENYLPSSNSSSSSNSSNMYNYIKSNGLKVMNKDFTYYVGRKMCIDNIMLKGHSAASKVHMAKVHMAKVHMAKVHMAKVHMAKVQVLNDYKNNILQHFTNYGSDHLPVIVITK